LHRFKLDRSDYKLIAGYLFIVSFWLIFRFTVEGYTYIEYLVDIPVSIVQIVVLLTISKWLIEYYFIHKGNLLIFITMSILGLWMVSFLTMLSGDLSKYGRIPWEQYPSWLELFIYNVHNSIYNIALPLVLISAKKYYEHELIVSKLKSAKKDVELKLLKSQFAPHFLYNSLNTIDALVDYSSKETIKEYVYNLARLYRHFVEVKDEDIILLEKEIALGKNYLYLMNTQFENDYNVEFKFTEAPSNTYLPNGALLTTLENIFKHNKVKDARTIQASIFIKNNQLCIYNDKSNTGIEAKSNTKTGLENLRMRYSHLSNEEIETREDETSFLICLPFIHLID